MMNKNKFCETLHGPLNKEMTEKNKHENNELDKRSLNQRNHKSRTEMTGSLKIMVDGIESHRKVENSCTLRN